MTPKLRCAVVDDEPLAVELLTSYIARLPDLELVGTSSNAVDAFGLVQRKAVDLLFLDIQMPRLTGIDFLKTLTRPPMVVMTTAYREFALEGYELDVVDFLLKPILFDRFMKGVGKAFQRRLPDTPEAASSNQPTAQSHLYIRVDKEVVKVLLTDILWVESMKDYVKIKTHQQTFVTYLRISYLEETLPSLQFIRIHRSFIVASAKITAFSAYTVRVGTTELPIGRNYRSEVMRYLEKAG
ncbi:LytR/AlgR family response regulator transcription factor [Spirosoma soli]|uniref:LytR/AlgR family response regulator transcription factor n=1 Tax=Spirosoma soli TaxID=1770529 RepID=A0ABW5M344_9BACT